MTSAMTCGCDWLNSTSDWDQCWSVWSQRKTNPKMWNDPLFRRRYDDDDGDDDEALTLCPVSTIATAGIITIIIVIVIICELNLDSSVWAVPTCTVRLCTRYESLSSGSRLARRRLSLVTDSSSSIRSCQSADDGKWSLPLPCLLLAHNSVGHLCWRMLIRWLSGRASDFRSSSRGFEPRPRRCCVTTLGKLFTPYCLCHQAV